MTETMPATPDTATTNDELCGTCGHSMSSHDVISSRFCAATEAGALDRGCVCPQGK